MQLTLEEKEKLLNKAKRFYEELKNIKIRESIEILDISRKYYPSTSRWSNRGFKYSVNGYMCCFGEDIKDSIDDLENYINFKKGIGEEFIKGKSVNFLSNYTMYALLDFISNANYIKARVEEENNKFRKELNDLLS